MDDGAGSQLAQGQHPDQGEAALFVLVLALAEDAFVLGGVGNRQARAIDADQPPPFVKGSGVLADFGEPTDDVSSQPPQGPPPESLAGLVKSLVGEVGHRLAKTQPLEDARQAEPSLDEASHQKQQNEGRSKSAAAKFSTRESQGLLKAMERQKLIESAKKRTRGRAILKLSHSRRSVAGIWML